MTTWSLQKELVELKLSYGTKKTMRVVIHPEHLSRLIYDACALAHRMYELMLIQRPGDLLAYLVVAIEECTERIDQMVNRSHQEKLPASESTESKPKLLPFLEFNRFFSWWGDDTEPEDEAWLLFVGSGRFENLLKAWFKQIQDAQSRLSCGDELQRNCFYRVKYGNHPLDMLERQRAVTISRSGKPEPYQKSAFLDKIVELVQQDDVKSVTTYYGNYSILRVLCNKQRQRTNQTGLSAHQAFAINMVEPLSASVSCDAWDAEICYYSEGLGRGDLFIAHPALANSDDVSRDLDFLFKHARFVLCSKSLGPIEGYTAEEGDGWWCYRLIDLSKAIAKDEFADRLNRAMSII
ncbi:hypothetical protein [Chitinibacter sp. GC72]|uniref:hypothetical protein n=1 Tax=Chitinibacter sp. GC72 TaxID=1526917 RepID=UPI0012FB5BC7|nr:hypothetical protein [Chitinibacter sp. GC72]